MSDSHDEIDPANIATGLANMGESIQHGGLRMRKVIRWKAARQVAMAITTCVSLSACAASSESGNADAKSATKQSSTGNLQSVAGQLTPLHRAAGEGKNYEWGKDHIFVKLSSAETGGTLTLIQDNLKSGFDLGLHLHRTHSEIFYILDGEVQFTIGQKPFTATTGAVVYLPAGTPHAATSSKGGKMLMFYTPGGFDQMLAEIDAASWLQQINPFATARRNEKYDMHKVSDGAQLVSGEPKPRTLMPDEGKRTKGEMENGIVKLSNVETDGLATLIVETLKPGLQRSPQQQGKQAQILYVLDGDVQYENAGKMHAATTGATIYFPPGMSPMVNSLNGAKMLVFRTPGDSPAK